MLLDSSSSFFLLHNPTFPAPISFCCIYICCRCLWSQHSLSLAHSSFFAVDWKLKIETCSFEIISFYVFVWLSSCFVLCFRGILPYSKKFLRSMLLLRYYTVKISSMIWWGVQFSPESSRFSLLSLVFGCAMMLSVSALRSIKHATQVCQVSGEWMR